MGCGTVRRRHRIGHSARPFRRRGFQHDVLRPRSRHARRLFRRSYLRAPAQAPVGNFPSDFQLSRFTFVPSFGQHMKTCLRWLLLFVSASPLLAAEAAQSAPVSAHARTLGEALLYMLVFAVAGMVMAIL